MTSNETPAKPKLSASVRYRTGDLEKSRTAVLDDLGDWVSEISFENMVKHLLPRTTHFDIPTTFKALQDAGELLPEGWKSFNTMPAASNLNESQTFKRLEHVHEKICQHAVYYNGETPLPTTVYVSAGFTTPSTTADGRTPTSSKPDGYGLLQSHIKESMNYIHSGLKAGGTSNKHDWFDFGYVQEDKKGDNAADREDNIAKVLWSMNHILRADARRRFTFGITTENATTRVWFACRERVLVSEPFNFMNDHTKYVQLVLSLSFGTVVELGWDPTMKLLQNDADWKYDIIVHDHETKAPTTYRTVRIISDFSADAMRGRGTRIFEAYELDGQGRPTGDPIAIKDFWLDTTRRSEAETLEAILKEATADEKEYFLTILKWGNVLVGPELMDDRTDTLIMKTLPIRDAQIRQFSLRPKERLMSANFTSSTSMHSAVEDLRSGRPYISQFGPKQHQRIVFKEVGTPIHDAKSIKVALGGICDAIHALRIMFHYGEYVHRDVSSGNILIVEGSSKAKLTDLEYAKIMGSGAEHDIRTGTFEFMAAEVSLGEYLFVPESHPVYDSDDDADDDTEGTEEEEEDKEDDFLDSSPILPKFVHNPIHDLESLWWIFVWFLFCNTIAKETSESQFTQPSSHANIQRAQAISLFSSSGQRAVLLMNPGNFNLRQGACLPVESRRYCSFASAWIKLLTRKFKRAESTLNQGHINNAAFKNIHQQSLKIFKKLFKARHLINYNLAPLNDVPTGNTEVAPALTPDRPLKKRRITTGS